MEIKKFGAMFLDGLRVGPGVTYDRYLSGSSCPKITFGSVPNEDCCIRWIKVGNLWVSTEVFCTNISYQELLQSGFIEGKPVRIGGRQYLCRSLDLTPETKAGCGMNDNEWTDILYETGDCGNIWPVARGGFWGKGCTPDGLQYIAQPSYWDMEILLTAKSDYRNPEIGFRPVLEPMDFILDESLLGRQIAVYYKTSHGVAAIGGRLRAYTDYELVLDGDDSNYDKSVYKDIACINGCIAYVDRACVDSVQLEPKVPAT